MAHERQGQAILLFNEANNLNRDPNLSAIATFLNPQMREILKQIREEPFLVNLLPHIVKFVESKSQSMMQSDEPVAGDVPIYNLIIQVLQSIYANKFFDSDS